MLAEDGDDKVSKSVDSSQTGHDGNLATKNRLGTRKFGILDLIQKLGTILTSFLLRMQSIINFFLR